MIPIEVGSKVKLLEDVTVDLLVLMEAGSIGTVQSILFDGNLWVLFDDGESYNVDIWMVEPVKDHA